MYFLNRKRTREATGGPGLARMFGKGPRTEEEHRLASLGYLSMDS